MAEQEHFEGNPPLDPRGVDSDSCLQTLRELIRLVRDHEARLAATGVETTNVLARLQQCERDLARSQPARDAAVEVWLQALADEADAEHRHFLEARRLADQVEVARPSDPLTNDLKELVDCMSKLFPREKD